MEDWWLLRKPLSEKTVAQNVLAHGCGALNIDAARIPSEGGRHRDGEASQNRRYTERGASDFAALPGPRGGDPAGRFPANLIHDGSPEVLDAFAAFGERKSGAWDGKRNTSKTRDVFGVFESRDETPRAGDTGTAARFFYAAKASRADRFDSKHPCVKPISIMRYLCRLVTPPGGLVLDPFAGSGTTLAAAHMEGFRSIGIEQEAEYIADIHRRIAALSVAKESKAQSDLFDAQNQAAEAAE